MRLKVALLIMGSVFLLATGFRPGALPFIPGAPFSDAVISHWPAALYLRESVLERGQFPLWRDTILAGAPFAANPLNKTAYPLQWLVLVLPPALHLDVMILLHLLLAGWGMWRWLRGMGLRQEAAAFGALAYALSPRILAHTGAGHLDVMYALAWWPFLMESVRAALSQDANRFLGALRVALFAALVVLADVRVSLFALGLAAVYGLYEVYRSHAYARLGTVVAVLPVFLLLTASVIVPVLAWRPYLSRAALSASDAGVFSLELGQFAGLLAFPAYRGTHELLTYLGLPVLALALLGIISQPRRLAFWWIVVLVAALYALGVNSLFWSLLVRIVPGLLWFRVPARAWLVVALIAPLLAAYGVEALLNRAEKPRPSSRATLPLLMLALVGFIGGGFMVVALPALRTVGVSWMLGALFAVVVLLGLSRRLSVHALTWAILIVTFAELAWTGFGWLSWRGAEDWLEPDAPVAERLVALGANRIYAPYFASDTEVRVGISQQAAAAYGLKLFGGVDPFQLAGVVSAIEQGSGVEVTEYSVVMPPLLPIPEGDTLPPDAEGIGDTQTLAEWGVSHILLPFRAENDRLEWVETLGDTYIYANLDYDAPALNAYDWPDNSPGLPDAPTVANLNNLTLASALISGLTFLLITGFLAFRLAFKRKAIPE